MKDIVDLDFQKLASKSNLNIDLIMEKYKNQWNKDLDQSDDHQVDELTFFDYFYHKTMELVKNAFENNPQYFKKIINRVDISEFQMSKLKNSENWYHDLSLKILNRIFIKISTQIFFSFQKKE